MDMEKKKHLLLVAERMTTVFSASMTARGSMGVRHVHALKQLNIDDVRVVSENGVDLAHTSDRVGVHL
jgi:hypothetical protein